MSLANSSMAKIIPPSGVLKAAAKPEAAPAIITFFFRKLEPTILQSFMNLKIEPAI